MAENHWWGFSTANILLIKSDIKWCLHQRRSLFFVLLTTLWWVSSILQCDAPAILSDYELKAFGLTSSEFNRESVTTSCLSFTRSRKVILQGVVCYNIYTCIYHDACNCKVNAVKLTSILQNRRGSRNFRQGGPTFRKFLITKKKGGGGEREGVQYLFCVSMVKIYFCRCNSFTDNNFYKYDIPRWFLQATPHSRCLF